MSLLVSAVLNRLEQLAGVANPQPDPLHSSERSTKGLVLPRKSFPTGFDGEESTVHTPSEPDHSLPRANAGAKAIVRTSLAKSQEGAQATATVRSKPKRAALWGDLPIMPGAPSDDGSDLLEELAQPSPSPPAVDRLIATLGQGAEKTANTGAGKRPQKQLWNHQRNASQDRTSDGAEEPVDAFMAVADVESQESEDELELGFPLEMMTEPTSDDRALGASGKKVASPGVGFRSEKRSITLAKRRQEDNVPPHAEVAKGARKQQPLFLRTSPTRVSSPSTAPLFQDVDVDAHLQPIEGGEATGEKDDAVEDSESLLEDEEHLEAWLLAHTRDEE